MRAVTDVLTALKLDGDVSIFIDSLAVFDERQRLVDKAIYDALEERHRVELRSLTRAGASLTISR